MNWPSGLTVINDVPTGSGVQAPKRRDTKATKKKYIFIVLLPIAYVTIPTTRPIVPDTNNDRFPDTDAVPWEL